MQPKPAAVVFDDDRFEAGAVQCQRPGLQGRGGRGKLALSKKEEDTVQDLFVATTHHLILCFTNTGKVYRVKAYEVPMASRTARGTPIVNIVPLAPGESITAMVPIESFDIGGFLVMVTKQGTIKRTGLGEFDTIWKSVGINAIGLHDEELTVAMSDPLDVMASDEVQRVTGLRVRRVMASREQVSCCKTKW